MKRFPHKKNELIAGLDETGRGCLAGPVFAAAVIMKKGTRIIGLDDSKKTNHPQRLSLRWYIEQKAIDWAVGTASPKEIDKYNILWASFLAMHRALDNLKQKPDRLIVDGNKFKKYKDIPHECIVGGDGKFASIAAASVLAKIYRDEYMMDLHEKFQQYDWYENKGYPTKRHRDGIVEYGPCEHHRQSFHLYPPPVQLDLFEEE